MLRFAANLSLLFCELPLPARFAAARAAGFAAVELQFPYVESARGLADVARAAPVDVVLINAPVAPDAPFGLACHADRRTEFRSGLEQAADYATALGVRRVNVLAGQAAGRPPEDCRRRLVDSLLEATELLAPLGIEVLLELLNPGDAPDYVVSDFAAAEGVLAACDGRVGLQFDLYHVARIGLDPVAALAAALPRVRHVQFADAPGRHEPGTGILQFEPVWGLLHRAGYAGYVAAEYRPSRDTADTLSWLSAWRRSTAPR